MRRIIPALLLITLIASPALARAQQEPDWNAIEKESTQLLSDYIRINTANPPGNEMKAATFLRDVLSRSGIDATIWEPAPGKANLVARWKGTGRKKPVILLNHMDVVPASPQYWKVDPFAGTVKDGYVWGRGAFDMKGVGITELMALVTLKRQGVKLDRDIIFVATSDEEVGGALGAGDVVKNHFDLVGDAELVLNEGGEIELDDARKLRYYGIVTAEKSPFWLNVVARGVPGHGSRPRPTAAPNRLVRALERIRTWETPIAILPVVERYFRDLAPQADPSLRPLFADIRKAVQDPKAVARITANPYYNAILRNTISITVLSGSNKTNVIPPEARAELDVRLLPGQDQQAFLADIRRVVADDSVEITPQGIGWPSTGSPDTSEPFRAMERVMRRTDPGAIVTTFMPSGFTDCHYFQEKRIPCYGIDPFKMTDDERTGLHGNDERVSTANLRFGTKLFYDILREVGGAK
ncbi:MAG TPA: M20/M25/M40 family metallo-hydrolase [Gemmatimonadaceae bacterium]|nr:M20/M25/M40 family metallo-hydrolase [Gemmatimonadaceae bacterium]